MRSKWTYTVYGYLLQLLALLLSFLAHSTFAQGTCTQYIFGDVNLRFLIGSSPLGLCTKANVRAYVQLLQPTQGGGTTVFDDPPYATLINDGTYCQYPYIRVSITYPGGTVFSQDNSGSSIPITAEQVQCSPCQNKSGTLASSQPLFVSATTAVNSLCLGGCMAQGSIDICGWSSESRQSGGCWISNPRYLDQACTPTSTSTGNPSPGQCSGTINGTVVNYPCSTTVSTSTSSATSTSTNGSSTTSTASNNTSTTTCSGGRCTTTTTTGSGSSGSTTTSTQDQSSFCKDNPQSPICKATEDSQFSGSCQSGFTCTGDAAQCAAAKGVYETRCNVDSLKTDSSNSTVQFGTNAMTGTDPSTHPKNSKQSVSISSFNNSNPFGATCPADHTITVMQAQVVIPFSHACGLLQLMGNLMVGLVSLACAFWLVRG
jgi:hypothetical protein